MEARIRIVIVDDHPAIQNGLTATLQPEPDMQVVGTAASSGEAVKVWREHQPDITLMDLSFKGAAMELRRFARSVRNSLPQR